MSNEVNSNNKRIAKNTILLYVRMLFTMFVGLYVSRVVLQALGASDFGVYNIVGGFVSMMSFLNSAFVAATQRFLSFTLGKGDAKELHSLFCTSVITHIVIAVFVLIVAETFGIWYINNYLNIDPDRIIAAHWVFQLSLLTMLITIISVPYNAAIVSHEHMHIYAYVSIAEALMKLGVAYLIIISPIDKLIVYAFMLMVVSVIVRICFTIYCKRFAECRFQWEFDKLQFKEMVSYAFWVMIGSLGFSFKDQFNNMILNGFFGTVINAARGIAAQASAVLNAFASNFFTAINPQITKQYASGNIEGCKQLVYMGAKFTFYMFALFVIPIYLNADYLLMLWLGEVPVYTSAFLKIILISTLIGTISQSTTGGIQATGNIKIFQIGVCVIFLAELPLAYMILKLGYEPYYALLPAVLTQFIGVVFRFLLLKKCVPEYDIRYFFINIVFRAYLTVLIAFAACYLLFRDFEYGFSGCLISVTASLLITTIIIYMCGISSKERGIINSFVKQKLQNHINH